MKVRNKEENRMKRSKGLLIGFAILCLAVVLLAGCVSKSEYEALQTDYEGLQSENAVLVQEKTGLIQENTSLKAELDKARSDLTRVKADHDKLKSDYDKLNSDYETANNELAEIKQVYPPRYFNDRSELEDWVGEAAHEVTEYSDIWRQHLELQKLALADGYIWSVALNRDNGEYISCVIAGDSIYWVWNDGYTEWVGWRQAS